MKEKLDELETAWKVAPEKLHQQLHQMEPQQTAQFMQKHVNFLNQLREVNNLLGTERFPLISEHWDELIGREQSYGEHARPEDYLESFNDFIRNQINESAALMVVVNRPKDLTRQQLSEIKLFLDQNGYSEAKLKTAWRNQTNQEIAASIIGYIRQAALGEALLPFEQRVANAMQKIYSLHSWTPVQRKWLERLAKQLTYEVVIDQQFINRTFAGDGGAKQLDKILGNQLDTILDTLANNLWEAAG
jgi:type I restriction enzyme R subunit